MLWMTKQIPQNLWQIPKKIPSKQQPAITLARNDARKHSKWHLRSINSW